MRRLLLILCFVVWIPAQVMAKGEAAHGEKSPPKKAIVLAAFGSTHTEALKAIMVVEAKVQSAFPGVPVRLAFTSNMIRNVWHSRAAATDFKERYPGVPEEITHVPSLLGALAELSDAGYKDVAVQSLHIAAGEEYDDAAGLVATLKAIKTEQPKNRPFVNVVLGRPAMGISPDGDTKDLKEAALALAGDTAEAKKLGAALLYVGHGNPNKPKQMVYARMESTLRQTYPGLPVVVSAVEKSGGKDAAVKSLRAQKARKVLIVPLLLVAGDHASNDICGPEADSWAQTLTKAGFEVDCRKRGLGEVDAFADLYVQHLKTAMTRGGKR